MKEMELILDEGEGYLIEFKESVSDSLAREMVAFANSSGGRVFVGISDDGRIKGVDITNRLGSQVYDIARKCDPPVNITLKEWENILIVEISEGTDKPYSCKDGFFIRAGSNTQKLRRDEIVDYFTHEGKIRFDEQFCMDFQYPDDFSQERFHRYLQQCGITSNLSGEQILTNLGVAQRQAGRLLMKNAGVLMFAREPTRFHFHAAITCVRFRGKTKTHIIDRKDFGEDIITNVDRAMKWLKTYIPLRYEITGKKLQRDEIPELPYDALREALLNSVVHRDYFEKGAVTMVEFYDDRVHIHNPGGLVKGIRPEEFGLTSISRNPFLQGLFHRANLVERIGSGIGRMMDEMKTAGLPEPEFNWNGFFRITFKRSEKGDLEVAAAGGTVSNTDFRILELIENGEIVRRPDVERLLHLSYATAQRHLANLVKKELILFEGAPKTGKYVMTRKGEGFLASLKKEGDHR
ncbi:MAG TPA: transcriptional regulator [Methanosarcinales archaeon]|nr:transcriptional regulator [Methanosarcinales archaeon]